MSCSKLYPCRLSRRQVIQLGAGAGIAGALGLNPSSVFADENVIPSGPGHVVQVHMPGMKVGAFPDPKAARIMVDRAVRELAQETDPGRAWLKFVSPTDKVGLKVNCLGTKMVSSMREVVFAVADAIREAGVPDENILIFDMYGSNMMGGRYSPRGNPKKMRILAHRDSGGYQKSWIHAGPARAKFAELFLGRTAIINIPPIKDHDLAGVTCTMKNMTYGTVEKPHVNHDAINEAIPYLWAREEIRSRVRLNLIDGTSILYDGGPKYNRSALVTHDSIYATTDPVAMDTIAGQLIESLRAQNGMVTLAQAHRSPKYLKLAQEMGLGINDKNKIKLQKIELPKFGS